MYGASADLSSYLNPTTEQTGSETSSSFTITTNADGTLTFSGSYTDEEGSSYSVSFDIAAEKETEQDTYTVTMSNFAISGSLSSAFSSDDSSVTATAKGITSIKVSAGGLDSSIEGLPIEITGEGLGTRTVDITKYLSIFDLLGTKIFSSYASAVTVTMTCTSGAELSINVGNDESITCGFTVATVDDEETALSFSATGLENIFDSLTVEGEITTVYANSADVTTDVVTEDSDPTAEPGEATWTLITNQFDGTLPGTIDGSNNSITLAWEDLESYEYLKVEAVTKATNSTYGCVLADASWSSAQIYSFTSNGVAGVQDEVIFNIADLKAQCEEANEESTAVYFIFWTSDIASVAIYASADYEPEAGTEEPGEETPELSTIYTETKTVTIVEQAAGTHDKDDSYAYGEVNYYGATSLTQLAVYGAFGDSGEIPSAEPEDVITATVTLDLTNCTATDCVGLQIAFQGFNTSWGGWQGTNSTQIQEGDETTTSFELTSTVKELLEANNISIDTYGGLALQIWNLGEQPGSESDYFGAIATYTITIEGVREVKTKVVALLSRTST